MCDDTKGYVSSSEAAKILCMPKWRINKFCLKGDFDAKKFISHRDTYCKSVYSGRPIKSWYIKKESMIAYAKKNGISINF